MCIRDSSNTYRMEVLGKTTWQNNLSAVGMGIGHVTGSRCMYFSGYSSPCLLYTSRCV